MKTKRRKDVFFRSGHFGSLEKSRRKMRMHAALAGFILKCGKKGSALYESARLLVQKIISEYLSGSFLENMHTVLCYLRLEEYLQGEFPGIEAFREKLKAQVSLSIEKRTELWKGYACRPSFLIDGKSCHHYSVWELAEEECEFIMKTQGEDGSWPVTWNWDAYPEAWAVSKKADIIIKDLLYLRSFGKI